MKSILPAIAVAAVMLASPADGHARVDDRETDPLVLKKLEWFQDIKFGLLMHWGPYSQWGVVESWSLCPEDEGWCVRRGPYSADYCSYKKAYEGLKNTFNPAKFDPTVWAKAAKNAGMKYVVFTTKHHDGFCMFDSKYTQYKTTDSGCGFSRNPRSNVAKEVFDAFRKEGLGIGAYFSKPDWHSEDYWWSYFPPKDRNPSYDIAKYPERWKRFARFTYNQIEELMTGYGKMDILWLDGGWVAPKNKGQDVNMPAIAMMARSHQPGLIVVDRAVSGRYENYRTPEQEIPDKPLEYVWETCMTMGGSWSYVPNDRYKPTVKIIQMLVDIVAKGGNYLLNVGPSPEGEFAPDALDRLNAIGAWMKVNGTAIYETRPVAPYREGLLRFTRSRDGMVNAIYAPGNDTTAMPRTISVSSFTPVPGSAVAMLGINRPLQWRSTRSGFEVEIPAEIVPPCKYAWTLRFKVK